MVSLARSTRTRKYPEVTNDHLGALPIERTRWHLEVITMIGLFVLGIILVAMRGAFVCRPVE